MSPPASPPRLTTSSGVLVADYRPGGVLGPRTLHDYELVWLLSGAATWRLERRRGDDLVTQTHLLRPGTITLARPGDRDRYQWDPQRGCRHAYLHFRIDTPGGLPPADGWPTVRAITDSAVLDGLTSYLTELADVPTAAARRRSDQVAAFLLDVFISGPFAPEAGNGPTIPSLLERLVSQVASTWEADGMRIVTAAELAEAAHLSRRRVFRLFQQEYQLGPARVLELVRLARAAVLLQRSNESIAGVATVTGFANPYHFSRRFTHTYGSPPGAFRAIPEPPDPLGPVRGERLYRLTQRLLDVVPIS